LLKESATVPAIAAPSKPRVEGEPGAPAPRGDSVALDVGGWTFKGNTVFSGAQLSALVADTVGRKLDLKGLSEAVGRIAAHYHRAGYPLAQAFLPRQQIKDGVIEVAVVESRVESVGMDPSGTVALSPGLSADLLRRVPTQQIAQDDSINRLALVANEWPGMSARVILKPGLEPGGTALLLKLDQAKPWAATAFLDNQGAYATGRNRLGVTGALYNKAGRGDSLDLAVVTTSGKQTFGSVDYSVVLSGAGDRLGVGLSHLSYALGGVYDGQGSGTADTLAVNYRYPLVRTPLFNLTAMARGERKQLRDHSLAAENNRHADVLTVGLMAARADAWGTGTGYAYLSGGRVGFDDAAAEALDQAALGPHLKGTFSKLSYGGSRLQRLFGEFALFGSVTGQVAGSHRLDSSERFSLGGANAVRAYPIGETTGDNGHVATAELRYAPQRLASAQFAVFYDAGRITRDANIDRLTDTPDKRGYGIAANYITSAFQVRGSLAWRSTGQAVSDPAAKGQQFYIQISTSF